MTRLPVPGSDDGTWGTVLNDFLDVEHNGDGSLKIRSDGTLAAKADDSAVVHTAGSETIAGIKTFSSAPVVPSASFPESAVANLTADLASKATTSYVDSSIATATANKTTWVNVRSVGAVGDGTADDTSAIQSAITNNNVIYFPAGHYKISSAITLHGVTIIGDGAATTIIEQTNTSADGFTGSNVAYLRISGIQLLGPGSGTGSAISLTGTTVSWYTDLSDMRLDSWGAHGFNGFTVIASLRNIVSANNGGHGFTLNGNMGGSAGTSTSFTNCYARSNGKAGYYLFNVTYCTFTGCAADLNGIGYSMATCTSLSLLGCGCESPVNSQTGYTGIGYKIDDCQSVTLTSPYLSNNLSVGYWVTGNSLDVSIIDAQETLPTGSATSSIQVDTGSRVQLLGQSLTTATSLAAGTTTVIGASNKTSVFTGNITAPTLTLTTGGTSGYILQSDASGNASWTSPSSLAGQFPDIWQPSDSGLLAAPFDPASCSANGSQPASGRLYLIAIPVRSSITISKVTVVIGVAGSGLTSGQCFLGLYSSTGTLLASTADQSTAFTSTGNISATLTTPYAAAAGTYYIGLLVNGTTSPYFACGTTFGANFTPGNANRTPTTARFGRGPSSQTSLPASVTMSSVVLDSNAYWAGVS